MSLIDDLVKLEEEAKELVAGADDAAKLEAARVELLGRKGRITGLMRMMGKLAPEDRPVMGKRANEMRQLIEGMLDERTTEMKAAALKHALEHEAVDITLPGIRPQIGHQHLIKQIIEEAEDIFCGIGYTVESGPMVDTSYYNFTALNAIPSTWSTTTPAASRTPRHMLTASPTCCCAPRPRACRSTPWSRKSRPST